MFYTLAAAGGVLGVVSLCHKGYERNYFLSLASFVTFILRHLQGLIFVMASDILLSGGGWPRVIFFLFCEVVIYGISYVADDPTMYSKYIFCAQ